MTAFSLGRDAASQRGIGLTNDDRGPVVKALGIITELIPAEAIAAYLAVVAAVAAFPDQTGQTDFRLLLDVWLAIPVGVLVSIAFAFIGAAQAITATPESERPGKVWGVFAYGFGLGVLFIVYVMAMPGNPVEVLWNVPSAAGGLAAVIFTIGWGIGTALWAALHPAALTESRTAE